MKENLCMWTLLTGVCLLGLAQQAAATGGTNEASRPLTLYVVADAHVGLRDTGETMMQFALLCNARQPDVVLDLGDAIHGERRGHYPMDHHEAALAQMQDWLRAWNKIDAPHKAIALGNRDVARHGIRREAEWRQALGYEDRAPQGGSPFHSSFVVDNGTVRALFIVTSSYSECYDRSVTLDWVREEVTGFEGDFIVFADHRISLYRSYQTLLARAGVRTPALFLHGHNHGPDTLVRDAWGHERDDRPLPAYLLTALFMDGVAAKFQLYPDGRYEHFRLDVRTQEISEPTLHHQTRVQP